MAKKSSFSGQLAKGFIRSAVNQVGRDGGRVVSNQVYGDAHSVPVRGTGSTMGQNPTSVPGSTIINSGNAEFVPTLSKDLPMWIVAIIFTLGIASIVAFFKGLHYYKKDTVRYRRYEVEQVPIIDRRFKTGIRGYRTESGYKYYDIPLCDANPDDVRSQKSSARLLMIVSGIVLFIIACAIFGIKPSGNFSPAIFVTIPLFALYGFAMWKPETALDFIGGSNAKRRVIATIAFIIIYCTLFAIKVKYYPDAPATSQTSIQQTVQADSVPSQ